MEYKCDRRLNEEYQVIIITKNTFELDGFKNSSIKKVDVRELKTEESNMQIVLTIKLFEKEYMPIEILRDLNNYLSETNDGYCELVCSYSEIKGGF